MLLQNRSGAVAATGWPAPDLLLHGTHRGRIEFGGSVTTTFNRGDTVYVHAIVSDPFGSFGITDAVAHYTLGEPNTGPGVVDASSLVISDLVVTGVRVAPTGIMNGAGGAGQPSFTVCLRVGIE